MATELIASYVKRAQSARKESSLILSHVEGSVSRILDLADLKRKLANAPLDVKDYFGESVIALEVGAFRSSVVMGWAGQICYLSEYLLHSREEEVRAKYPSWNFKDANDLRQNIIESQILIAFRKVGLCTSGEHRILDGELSVRNQCAHATIYKPSRNETIGYVEKMINRSINYVEKMKK